MRRPVRVRDSIVVVPPPARVAEDVSIGGIVSGLRPLKTRKGDRMCVFMLEDAGGSIEVVVFPETFKQCGHLAADNGGMVLVKGKFERDDESARVLATEIVAARDRAGAAGDGRWPSGCQRRRTDARRSRSCGTSSRITRAIVAWRSTWSCRRRAGVFA